MPKKVNKPAKSFHNIDGDNLSRYILEYIPDILWVVDGNDTTFKYITPSVSNFCGFLPDEIIGRPVNYLFTEDSCTYIREAFRNWNAGNTAKDKAILLNESFGIFHKSGSIIQTITSIAATNFPIYNKVTMLGISRHLTSQTRCDSELQILHENLQEKYLELQTAEEILKTNLDELQDARNKLEEKNKDLIRAREFVKESENRYRKLFENIPDGFTVFRLMSRDNEKNIDFKVVEINNTAEAVINKVREEVIGLKLLEVFPEFDVHLLGVMKNVALTGESRRFEYFSRNIFHRHYLLSFYSPEKGYVAMVSEDITERKKAEEELKEKTDQLQKLFNYNLDLLCIADSKGYFLHLNAEWSKTLGYKLSDMEGKQFIHFVHPDDVEVTLKTMDSLQRQEEILNFINRYRCKDGSYRWIEWRSYPAGNLIYSAARDITQSKLAEDEFKKRDLLLRESQRVARLGHYVLNILTTYWESSETLDDIFGIDKNYIRDVNGWLLIVHPDQQDMMYNYFVRHVIGMKNQFDKEYKIIRINDRKERWVHGKGNLKFDSSGNPVELFGTIQDITERKYTEEELVRAKDEAQNSNRLKTVFLQNMSHEIRTPMNAIMGFSDLIRENIDNREKLKSYTSIIRQRGNDLLELINEMLDLSKIETGQFQVHTEDCNLREMFRELYDLFNNNRLQYERSRVELLYECDNSQKQDIIRIDAGKLKQIFINLIHNAFKYTKKGYIKFGCQVQANHNIVFFVSDTGPGISEDKQDRIFDRFMQIEGNSGQQNQGTGLGLAIVKGLVNLLGGEITLKSIVGKGSTFLFSLPYEISISKPVNSVNEASHLDSDLAEYSILIVEDDGFNAEFLSEVLKGTNISITSVDDGQKAISLFKSGNLFDIILMDIRLTGIDGYETTKIIKSLNPRVKVIAQTAYASPADKKMALDAGCDDYISKPIDRYLLISKISEQLKK